MSASGNLLGVIALVALVILCGCAKSPDEVLFATLASRAETGSAEVQYNLGMLYNNGIGTAPNPTLAFQWFDRAARGGDALASYKVGCYYAGQFRDVVSPDKEKALAYKLVAANAGYMFAQHDVAIAYSQRGADNEASKWWELAAAQGDFTALVSLAHEASQGRSLPANAAKAYEYLLEAKRILPESQARQLQPQLDEQRKAIDLDAATSAEKTAEAWTPHPTALTMRAREGIEEARRLVK